ncbi:MAG: hypothetical protein QNJ68_12615 [Microcoleaceae cyanobacterium MO_207.B10]|nr:hypothetical protein [Microcoleaceae cyanobacterium MO_207.B10]
MITEKFRRLLRQEAKLWQAEELISDRFYQKLSALSATNLIL